MPNSSSGLMSDQWFITLHDLGDHSRYIDNGLFMFSKDVYGGWREMESRLSLDNLKMLGEKCPKDKAILANKLQWRQAEIIKKGYKCVIPTLKTFSELIEYLTQANLLPSTPDPNFSNENTVDDQVIIDESQSPSLLQEQEIFAQEVTDSIEQDSQLVVPAQQNIMYVVEGDIDVHKLQQDFAKLQQDYDLLLTENKAIQHDKRKILEQNAVLEEEKSANQSGHTNTAVASLKGVLQAGLQDMSNSLEATTRREIRDVVKEQFKFTDDTIFELSTKISYMDNKIDSLESTIAEMSTNTGEKIVGLDHAVQTLVRDSAQNQGSLDRVLQISKDVNIKLSEDSGPRASASLDDSGFQERSHTKTTRNCSFCLRSGHGYETCLILLNFHFPCFWSCCIGGMAGRNTPGFVLNLDVF